VNIWTVGTVQWMRRRGDRMKIISGNYVWLLDEGQRDTALA